MQRELQRLEKKPRLVDFSTATDLFQPVPELLDMAYEVCQILLAQGIKVSFLTKGQIPDRQLDLFRQFPWLVHAGIRLITLDEDVLRLFEPRAASASVRLAQGRRS